ncbi:MAG: MFS transporter [Promethearchaeia archaeon]
MRKTSSQSSLVSIILFITIIALVNSMQNMISPNLIIISDYFGFKGTKTGLGFLTFIFTILSGISMIIFGILTDKFTRKWIVFAGTTVYSFFSVLIILVPPGLNGYYFFFFLTCIIGVGYGAIIPSIFSLIGDLVSQDDRSKGFSFFSIASLFGLALGMTLATAVGGSDWRISYFIVGIAGLISAFVILKFKEPSRLGKDNLILLEKDGIDYTYRIKKEDLPYIFKKKSNIWLIVNFVDTIPTGLILFLLFAYMKEYHNIPSSLALIFLMLILISTLFGTVIFGFIGDNMFKKGKKKARVYLALMANIAPIPFVFIALIIPFRISSDAQLIDLFLVPGAVLMLILMIIGLFLNGAVNGSWYATVVDINLPEHRATVLSTANFFDIIGRAIGPLIGAIIADNFGILWGMMISIFFWSVLPFFWIPVLKNVVNEMEETNRIFRERLEKLANQKINKE